MPQPAIQVHNLDKQFDEIHAVNDVSFDVQQGEIFSLLGPNGAGKSTTISMISGLLLAEQGDREGAQADFERAAALEPAAELLSHFLVERSRVASALGDLPGAIADMQEALALVSNQAGMYLELGLLQYEDGALEEALDSFNAALEDQPDNIDGLAFRGRVQAALGNSTAAQADLCRSGQLMADGETQGVLISQEELADILAGLGIEC